MQTVILIAETVSDAADRAGSEEIRRIHKAEDAALRLQLFREGLRSIGLNEDASRFTSDQIEVSSFGKPYFRDIPQAHISLSHSGNYIACAFSDVEIGLDLQECISPHTDVLRLVKRFFTSQEYEALLSVSGDDKTRQREIFFRLWAIKEAYLKYIGCGLSGELNSFLPDPLPLHNDLSGAHGLIRVLEKTDLLTPAEYSLLPAPEGFTMAVSAQKIPSGIVIRYYDASGRS